MARLRYGAGPQPPEIPEGKKVALTRAPQLRFRRSLEVRRATHLSTSLVAYPPWGLWLNLSVAERLEHNKQQADRGGHPAITAFVATERSSDEAVHWLAGCRSAR